VSGRVEIIALLFSKYEIYFHKLPVYQTIRIWQDVLSQHRIRLKMLTITKYELTVTDNYSEEPKGILSKTGSNVILNNL
jgi:hypothetical protein